MSTITIFFDLIIYRTLVNVFYNGEIIYNLLTAFMLPMTHFKTYLQP